MQTHYQTLKVVEDAPPEVIKAAYRALSQQHHPDSSQAATPEAVRHMQCINEAYETLMDEESRAAYDRQLRLVREAGSLVKQEANDLSAVVPALRPRRRRRSRSQPAYGENSLVRTPSDAFVGSSGVGRSGPLVRAESSLAPMFTSRQSNRIHGRIVPQAITGSTGGQAPTWNGNRGGRAVWMVLAACTAGVLLLGGLAAWKLGFVHRAWAWFQRQQAQEASRGLVIGGNNDVMPLGGLDEPIYDRPPLTPHGHRWPETTGYLQGAEQLHGGGGCKLIVDNLVHGSDVHAKLLALPGDKGGTPAAVREAYIKRGTEMGFDDLQPGTYELRYRSLGNGLAFRAAVLELSLDPSNPRPSKTVSLYKVMSGNIQRPVIPEGDF